jgi:hypothetical protein
LRPPSGRIAAKVVSPSVEKSLILGHDDDAVAIGEGDRFRFAWVDAHAVLRRGIGRPGAETVADRYMAAAPGRLYYRVEVDGPARRAPEYRGGGAG